MIEPAARVGQGLLHRAVGALRVTGLPEHSALGGGLPDRDVRVAPAATDALSRRVAAVAARAIRAREPA